MHTRSIQLLVALLILVFVSSCGGAGRKVNVGRKWPGREQISIDRVDHAAWNALLGRFVDDRGRVDYARWQRSKPDVDALDNYLATLSKANPALSARRDQRLAFWINAYNALTVRGILREYPTTSIRNHTSEVGGYNIWHDLLLTVGDDAYSLDRIEHRILRKTDEPRVHFAIVCASNGCPRLRNEAYHADGLDDQLTDNAKVFFADDKNFRAAGQGNHLSMSPLLNLFAEDFGPDRQTQLRKIAPFLPDEVSREQAARGDASVQFLDYDWELNEQPATAK